MNADGRREPTDPRQALRPVRPTDRERRPRTGFLLFLLALATVGLVAGAHDFTDEARRRQRIRVHLDRELATLGARPDPERRRRLGEEILEQPLVGLTGLGPELWAGGVLPGGWTLGTRRAAVLVSNSSNAPRAIALQLLGSAEPRELPQKAYVDDGAATRTVLFATPGPRVVALPRLVPGSRRLLAVWTDEASSTGAVERGVRIRAGDPVPLRLLDLRATRDPKRWRLAAEELATDAYLDRFALGDPRLTALGVTADGSTLGSAPAAVLAVNPRSRPFTPRLKLRGPEEAGLYPLTVSIDYGRRVRQLTLEAPGTRTVRLRRVGANAKRLFVLWTGTGRSRGDEASPPAVRIRARAKPPAGRDRPVP